MNKFAEWVKINDKKQRGVAEKLGISTSTLHDILRKDQMPSLVIAYKIEQYTQGAITLYDWLDERLEKSNMMNKNKTESKEKKIKE